MGERPTVLVVDDEPDLADLYAAWLEETYDVRIAYGGAEAMSALESSIDVALIDRLMPRVSGEELLAHIREEGYDCRASLVTAVDPDFDIIEMGFDEYLVKPIRRDEIVNTVEALLTRSAYDEKLQEFFALASKRATLETEKTATELEESDAYDALTTEFEQLGSELSETVDQLRPRDLDVEMRQLASSQPDQ